MFSMYTDTNVLVLTENEFTIQTLKKLHKIFFIQCKITHTPIFVHTLSELEIKLIVYYSNLILYFYFQYYLKQSRPEHFGGPKQNLIWGPLPRRGVTCV